MRECWNWQTGKTKDLVGVCSCGFKSHLPHDAEVAELADAHGSGPCGSNTVRVQVSSSARIKYGSQEAAWLFGCAAFCIVKKEASGRCGIMPGLAAFFSQLPLVI